MGIFKQQERRQQRKKARQEELDAKRAARDAAEEARQAAAAEYEERARRREAVLVAAKAKQRAAAKKRKHEGARPFAGAPTARETIAGLKRGAEEAAAAAQKTNGGKKRKTAAAAAVTADAGKKTAQAKDSPSSVQGDQLPSPTPHERPGGGSSAREERWAWLRTLPLVPRCDPTCRLTLKPACNSLPARPAGAKLDSKSDLKLINELAELSNCNGCMFFEARKQEDLNLWLAKTPNGPSVQFHVQNGTAMSFARDARPRCRNSDPRNRLRQSTQSVS
ncbi:MAG: hypothetical protein BJ554DRAFT_3981 [Olpidium bornovanus]|uniref:Uncharacterized protein n=1 Tax=Olpidium bornovanus TaxID=278681 RepID=A0A8H7ZMS2_9FUNG|nr:MAG: hypothetical protein BJ554DRAFT_3981 [Olpidium bornovanus]